MIPRKEMDHEKIKEPKLPDKKSENNKDEEKKDSWDMKKDEFNPFFWRWRRLFGLMLLFGGILATFIFKILFIPDALMSIGTIGLGVFISVFAGLFLITDGWSLKDGEFRKAITISIISVYFFIMSYGKNIITPNETMSYGFAGSNITLSNGTLITLSNGATVTSNGTLNTLSSGTTVALNNVTPAILTNSSISGAMTSLYTGILSNIFDNFWVIVLLVIGAYFAARGYEIKKGGTDGTTISVSKLDEDGADQENGENGDTNQENAAPGEAGGEETGKFSPMDEIKKAKDLMDNGAITDDEFKEIKEKYLENIIK